MDNNKVKPHSIIQAIVAALGVAPKIKKLKTKGRVENLPEALQGYKKLRAAYVGECGVLGKWSDEPFPNSAHAHTRGKYRGIICFRDEKALNKKTTCWHELAHILSKDHSNHGHNRAWAEQYVKLVNGEKKWLTVEWLQRKYKFK